jgi:hypothetical protein
MQMATKLSIGYLESRPVESEGEIRLAPSSCNFGKFLTRRFADCCWRTTTFLRSLAAIFSEISQ